MQAERWKKVEEVYQAAVALAPEKRAEFLSQACPDDAELREEVRSLLAQDVDSFLESGPVSAVKTLKAGAKLGHFEIVGLIGRGGMGEVYRARDTLLKRNVAIKILPAALARDPDRIARFEREARAAGGLNDSNIVAIYEFGIEGDTYWIASELVAGESLAKLMERGPMVVGKAIEIAGQIADGLAAAHAAGIVHRDLKPANIMVARDGRVKILDFGLALRRRNSQDSGRLEPTGDGTIVGTAGYMSPEQVRGEDVDQRSDLFSFGVILYEMLAGKRAFTGGSSVELMHAILKEEPAELPSSAPPAIAAIVHHCLEKLTERRFQSALDLGYALRLAVAAQHQVEPRLKPKRWPLAALSVAVVMLVAAGLVYSRLPRESPPEDIHPVPLMAWPGGARFPTFSPDGNRVAFSWNSEKQDTFHIYVTQIGSGARPVQLTSGLTDDSCSAWSPDDRYIAFMRGAGSGRSLMLAPPIGGPDRKVADFPGDAGCPSWTPDSKWVATPIKDSPQAPYAIWLVSVSTGERRRLTNPPSGQSGDQWPSISPDGRALAFFREVANFSYALYRLPMSGDFRPEGEPRELRKEGYGGGGGTTWTADGHDIVYSAGALVGGGLFRLSVSGHPAPTRVPYAFQNGIEPAISPTRQRLVYVHVSGDETLMRLDTRTGERSALVVSSGGSNLAQYSPDGRKLAFQSSRSGEGAIWTCDADGSNCMQLASFGRSVGGAARWSPDSQWIAFDWRVTGQAEIYVMQADGGGQRRLTNGPGDNITPSWSHDGLWIYFASDRTGRTEVWKIPVAGGAAVQVTHDGGGLPVESADGEYLYYQKCSTAPSCSSPAPLARTPARGGPETQILPRVANFFSFAVAAKAIYFTPDGKSLQRLDLSSGKVSNVATMENKDFGLSVSPDERFVVWPQSGHFTAELMLVEGYR